MSSDKRIHVASLIAFILFAIAGAARGAETGSRMDFARDVRPILADKCFHCHGPDEETREAGLRLDVWEDSDEAMGAEAVVTRKQPAESELITRIYSDDPDMRMPPADSGKTLSPEQIETLREWVTQGAEIRPHWAFIAPERPTIPRVQNQGWVRNGIDAFVLAKLEREGLEPSKPAETNSLLRRLSLDLIGLPPTLEEVAAYASADENTRYAQQVARLLGSPHFGEHWGRLWLDAARYSDSDGFEKDKPRIVWMYRDWVINAINADMPYDEFLIEQIAGDLLAEPTQDNLVATGFLRNSMTNEEGGIDPEQFRMEAMYDRMDAVGKGILGLTIQCAQCHTHKYDPLTHTDYYRMLAFLNNCHEAQVAVYTPAEREKWKATVELIKSIENGIKADNPDWSARMEEWECHVRDDQPKWTVIQPLPTDSGGQKYFLQEDGSILAAGYNAAKYNMEFSTEMTGPEIRAIRLELMADPSLPCSGPGRSIYGTCALTEMCVDAAPLDNLSKTVQLKFVNSTADVNPPERELEKMFDDRSGLRRVVGPINFAIDDNPLTAWSVEIGAGRSNVPRKAIFVLDEPLPAKDGVRLTFRLIQEHGGWNNSENQTNNMGRFRFSVTSAENAVADPLPTELRAILEVPPAARTTEQLASLFSFWRTTVPEWQEQNRRIEALWQRHPRGTTQLTLLERERIRPTHRLDRGNFLAPQEEVAPGVPSFLHSLEKSTGDSSPPTRLDFARWLADRRSPTTARSIVNRIWQAYFGIGLVATTDDLGTQGEFPSNVELLDWLAIELMDNNWSLKHIHMLIVDSATYRQSSKVTPELLVRDPDNRLLARGPRQRVDAEVVRDIALSASGLLNLKIGGPSVYPPAPDILFVPPASYGTKSWIVDIGSNRYRRGLYTFRFRSVPHPALQSFDSPNAELACVRRARSNTPVQALTTLNEPLFLESARALATIIVAEGGPSDDGRIAYAVRRCLAREPESDEIDLLQHFVSHQKQKFSRADVDPLLLLADDDQAKESLVQKLPVDTTPAELAAWTALARVVLNLDETITKE
jgi:hypothetical protein